jgi:hypothetical protein
MRFRAFLCRTSLHRFVKISPNYQIRALSISHQDFQKTPKGFGNFKGKESSKKAGKRRKEKPESSENQEPEKQTEKEESKSDESGGDQEPKQPKKPKKKKEGDEVGPLDKFDFNGTAAQQVKL